MHATNKGFTTLFNLILTRKLIMPAYRYIILKISFIFFFYPFTNFFYAYIVIIYSYVYSLNSNEYI